MSARRKDLQGKQSSRARPSQVREGCLTLTKQPGMQGEGPQVRVLPER